MPTISTIEVLENRIAPAVLLVSSATSGDHALKILKGGAVAEPTQAEADANTLAGSTAAVLLNAGDSLLFDTDGSGTVSDGDQLVAAVKGGKAMIFLTDLQGGAHAGGFDINEITGVSVSDKFKGQIGTDVNGTVLTALDAKGNLTGAADKLTLQHSSILSLTVDGQINQGDLLSGGSMSNVLVGGPKFNTSTPAASVTGSLATGTAAAGKLASLNGGEKAFTVEFTAKPGESGGSISKVKLLHGASSIVTGDGADIEKGKAGVGGSLSDITVLDSIGAMRFVAGQGGEATTSGTGGAGGSISRLDVTLPATSSSFRFEGLAGSGGDSANGSGGAGGRLESVKVHMTGTADFFTATAGSGGSGGVKGNGGAGGSMLGLEAELGTLVGGGVNVYSGDGGDSGAQGGNGGLGGAIRDLNITVQSATQGESNVVAGGGGDGFAKAGAAGSLLNVNLTADALRGFRVGGSSGGSATGAKGQGGAGGGMQHIDITLGTAGSNVLFQAGAGGTAPTVKTGVGGGISDLSFRNTGALNGTLTISSGAGGDISYGDGMRYRASGGGVVKDVSVNNEGGINRVDIFSGKGGSINAGSGTAGASGGLTNIAIHSHAAISAGVAVHSGEGGTLNSGAAGNGGNSGALSGIDFEDTTDPGASFEAYAGVPASNFGGSGKATEANGPRTKGGDIGSVMHVHLEAPHSKVIIGKTAFAGRSNFTEGTGGRGGDIVDITGAVGTLDVLASSGGSSSGGKGGAGGSVIGVKLTTVTNFVHMISAGDGGASGIGAGGLGGSVRDIDVAGADIGDFSQAFAVDTATGSGGLIAGKGGTGEGGAAPINGEITNVQAGRIAAILAGHPQPGSLTASNAVAKIAGVFATKIGLDLDGDSTFDFTNNDNVPEFQLGGGDRPTDGFVLVKAGGGGASLPAGSVLKLIEV